MEVRGTTTFVLDGYTTYSSSTLCPAPTHIPDASGCDMFGIHVLHPSSTTSTRDWFNQWGKGSQRSFKFGAAGPTDPELVFRGSGVYTIYGGSGARSGHMRVSGSGPRIYVRASDKETDKFPESMPKWGNVEITFYATTTDPGASVGYAGIEVVARTNHCPDNLLCSARGYGGKINFDGRVQFEKETCHGQGNKQTTNVYPFDDGGRMPMNTWFGYKYVVRACQNNTMCKLELYMDRTDGINGGTWKKLHEFTDYDGWSSDTPSCCDLHKGRVLLPPHCTTNYSVCLRTDGIGEQFYKKFSIREIDPLP